MKHLILSTFIIAASLTAKSQITNSSFENLNPNGTIKNWGDLFLWSVTLDTNGVWQTDSIIFDNQLYFSTNDAHTGTKALEMRNAFNYTTNQKIAGSARLTQSDTDYAVFTQLIFNPQRPSHFTFFHKFFPVASDTAYASMTVLDTLGNDIGYATAEITAPSSVYTQISKPINYFSTEPGGYIMVGFKSAKPGSAANFGTRFLVDDVGMLFATSVGEINMEKNAISCFPNPAPAFIHLLLNAGLQGQIGLAEISDITGKIVKTIPVTGAEKLLHFETTNLASGLYSISFATATARYKTTFIK